MRVLARRASDAERWPVHSLATIGTYRFPLCPICLVADADSREHVPMESIGGTVRTWVCDRRNGGFGARYEPHLQDWYHDRLRAPRIRSESSGVPGRRRLGDLLVRWTSTGESVLLTTPGKQQDVVSAMLQSGSFVLELVAEQWGRIQIAALKHVYLAACIQMQRIPTGTIADQIRDELVAARDWPDRQSFPESPWAQSLYIERAAPTWPHLPPLAVVAFWMEGGWGLGVVLARGVLVSWPLPDRPLGVHEFDEAKEVTFTRRG